MSIPQRKVAFYSIRVVDKDDNEKVLNPSPLKDLLGYILSLERLDRILDYTSERKVNLLEFVQVVADKFYNITMESSKYFHRPNLLDKTTGHERTNPKKATEGDAEKTHISLSFKKDEIIVLLEERKSGLSMGRFIGYLEFFGSKFYQCNNKSKPYILQSAIIPKKNFVAELRNLSRVKVADVYMEKQVLGSDFLNLSQRTNTVNESIVISVKAKTKKSIQETALDIYSSFGASGSKVSKLRVVGQNSNGNQIILDTDIIKKIEYIDVALDEETGIVAAKDIFLKFDHILRVLE
jgi:hypothetical protein